MSDSVAVNDMPRVAGRPVSLNPRAYKAVEDAAVVALMRSPSVRGVFKMGSIREPGISDLDIIAVVDDGSKLENLPDVRSAHPLAGYVLMHSPFLMTETMFSQVRLLAGISHLSRIAGDLPMPNSEDVPSEIRLAVAARYTLDALYFCSRERSLGTLRVRAALCTLNTMSHLLDLIREVVGVPSAASDIATQIERLRRSWFSHPDIMGLWALVSDAIPAYLLVLDAIGAASPPPLVRDEEGLSWMNMRVTISNKERSSITITAPRARRLLDCLPAGSRHTDDVRWSQRTCLIDVPQAVGALLSPSPNHKAAPLLSARAELAAGYAEWFGDAPAYFSMLAPRVDTPEPAGTKWRLLALARRFFAT